MTQLDNSDIWESDGLLIEEKLATVGARTRGRVMFRDGGNSND